MTTWDDLAKAHPDFAKRVRSLFDAHKHKTMATLRRDGSPRISGTELEFKAGEITVGMMPASLKALDLRRDPRLALHSASVDVPEGGETMWAGDAKIAGLGVETSDAGREDQPHSFTVDITEVVLTRVGDPPDHLVIESWHPGRGLERKERR